MKKLLFLILFLSGFANAQIVNIPDADFKAILTSKTAVDLDGNNTFIDANRDGEIQVSEAFNISSGFSIARISDLTGIEAFVNIKTLILIDVELTSIDISKNNQLEEFTANNNNIENIDMSNEDDTAHILSNFTLDEFISLTDEDNTLKIFGDDADKIQLDVEQNWTQAMNADTTPYHTISQAAQTLFNIADRDIYINTTI